MMLDADSRFARCLAFVLKKEGPFSNDPQDPGGATNHGVTIHTLSLWRKHPATIDDVRNLSLAEATEIYRTSYWHPGDKLPAGVDLLYFNAAVNCGQGHASHFLQEACGATSDGVIGPATMAKVAGYNPQFLVSNFCTAQMAYYRRCHGWAHDGHGWTNRTNEVQKLALSMAAGA